MSNTSTLWSLFNCMMMSHGSKQPGIKECKFSMLAVFLSVVDCTKDEWCEVWTSITEYRDKWLPDSISFWICVFTVNATKRFASYVCEEGNYLGHFNSLPGLRPWNCVVLEALLISRGWIELLARTFDSKHFLN